jgi:hypothetical protein
MTWIERRSLLNAIPANCLPEAAIINIITATAAEDLREV